MRAKIKVFVENLLYHNNRNAYFKKNSKVFQAKKVKTRKRASCWIQTKTMKELTKPAEHFPNKLNKQIGLIPLEMRVKPLFSPKRKLKKCINCGRTCVGKRCMICHIKTKTDRKIIVRELKIK